jgi:hypothetical protein
MKHLQRGPKKPLFNEEEGEIFISYIDEDIDKKIAELSFVHGLKGDEVGEMVGYSKREIERRRVLFMKQVLKKLIQKELMRKEAIGDDNV